MARGKGTYRQALRNRDFRLLVTALSQSAAGDWAYNVALVVYVYDKTHSPGWVAAATLGRMIPRLLASLYAGVIAERFERVRVMVSADVLRAGIMAAMAASVAASAPAVVPIAFAGLLSVVSSVYDPATAAMLPQLLGEDNLASGNALTETINNAAIIAGPALGAIVLVLGSPSIVMALDAVTFVISAVVVGRITARSKPTDVTSVGGPLRQMLVGFTAITHSLSAALLVSFTVMTTALYGVDSVLFVFLSKDRLGTGATGYGYLLVALGVGGIIASTFVNRMASLPRLSTVLAVGMCTYALPTVALVAVHSPALASVIEVVRGVATLIVDVLAMTALQRSLAPDMIARVFGVFWAVVIGGLALGAFVTPFLLNGIGLNGTLLLAGLVAPALVVLAYPKLATLDRMAGARAQELAPRIRVLEGLQIFAAAPAAVLERLAGAVGVSTVPAGQVVVAEGEEADALYVLASGQVEVQAAGELGRAPVHIRFMQGPSYFGEIGLIERIPRTATVRTVGECELWRVDGEVFLTALTEGSPSQLLMSGLVRRLASTHPSRAASHQGAEPRASGSDPAATSEAPPPRLLTVPVQPAPVQPAPDDDEDPAAQASTTD